MKTGNLKIYFVLASTLIPLLVMAQHHALNWNQERSFFMHLVKENLHEDLTRYRNHFRFDVKKEGVADTLQYYTGRAHLKMQNYDTAIALLNDVGSQTPMFLNARMMMFSAGLDLYDYPFSDSLLSELEGKETEIDDLICYERSGIALLNRSIHQFDSLQLISLNIKGFRFQNEMTLFRSYAEELRNHKRKHPWLAGVMSAAIPGLGKAYLGKPGHGLSSLTSFIAFGIQAYEGYRRQGAKSPHLYIFGAAATAVYIANIWGSVLMVKIIENEFNYEMDHKILVGMRIPIQQYIR